MASDRLVVNTAQVVGEMIDGEVILIHLGTGTYYSLDGLAADIWTLVTQATTREDAVLLATRRYESQAAEAAQGVRAFLDQLLAEDLVIEAGLDLPESGSNGANGHVPSAAPAGAAFVAPTLNTYTDLQDFLLADPLHDVDEQAGWPHVNAG